MQTITRPLAVTCCRCGESVFVWESRSQWAETEGGAERRLLGVCLDSEDALCFDCATAETRKADLPARIAAFSAHPTMRDRLGLELSTSLCAMRVPRISDDQNFTIDVYGVAVPGRRVNAGDNRVPLFLGAASDPAGQFVFRGFRFAAVSPPNLAALMWWDEENHLEIVGWDGPDVNPEAVQALVAGAIAVSRLSPFQRMRGRPRGRLKRDQRWYFEAFRAHARAIGRAPKRNEFCTANGVGVRTLRSNLKYFGFADWEAFVRRATETGRSVRV